MANVRVFNFREEGEKEWEEEWGGNVIDCRDISPHMDLRGCDLAILPFDRLFFELDQELEAVEQLQSRIELALEQGTHVCLLYPYVYMPGDFRKLEDYLSNTQQALGERILRREEIDVEKIARTNDLKCLSKQLEPFVREYAATEYCFTYRGETQEFLHVVCETTVASKACGVALQKGKALLYVIPGEPVRGAEEPFIKTLVECLLADLQARLYPKTAPIAESFQFAKEKALREDRQAAEAKLQEIEATIAEYQERKDILFLRDDPLADRLREWLSVYLGIKTKRIEKYIEDFWILDASESEIAICEAKGLSGNVKREHITQLVLHREHRDLPEEFPSILIVNTFAEAKTVDEKARQRIGGLECRKAAKSHVLVLRTLDLVRLLDLAEQGKIESSKIKELLMTEIGWLRVWDEGYEVAKD